MGMSSTNGSQLWDLGFITQALVESGLAQTDDPSTRDSVVKALEWIDRCQILENPKVSGGSSCGALDRFSWSHTHWGPALLALSAGLPSPD
jgi:squalene cyclase